MNESSVLLFSGHNEFETGQLPMRSHKFSTFIKSKYTKTNNGNLPMQESEEFEIKPDFTDLTFPSNVGSPTF